MERQPTEKRAILTRRQILGLDRIFPLRDESSTPSVLDRLLTLKPEDNMGHMRFAFITALTVGGATAYRVIYPGHLESVLANLFS